MPDDSEAAWLSLLIERRNSDSLGTSEATARITDDKEFRSAFENICEERVIKDPQRLLGNFLLQFKAITAFTKELDSSRNFEHPANLTSLFWAYAFVLIEAALKANCKLPEFARELRVLNKAIPNFGPDLTLFSGDDKVQAPLRQIYSAYLNSYEAMISYFATSPVPLEFTPITQSFDTATAIIKNAKQQWERALKDAKEQEKNQLLTSSSMPNGLDGESLQAHATNVHFQVIRYLGDGAHGRVSVVRETATGQVYARKLIRADPRNAASVANAESRVKAEVSIMQKLRHHHIASCLFFTRDAATFSIVMLPVADCDLNIFLDVHCTQRNYPRLTIKQLDNWFGCLVSALTYAHGERIKHEDIKPSNILIKNDQPYLADFGSAKDFSHLEASTRTDELIFGTPVYYSPEPRPWGRLADVFALGCVFSEMLTVRHHRSLQEYRDFRVVADTDNRYAFRSNLRRVQEWTENLNADGDALQLVSDVTLRMLEADPARRPEAKQVKRRFRSEEDMLFCHTCS